jgi:S-formylglutathione hydrolase FrmB
VAYGLIDVADQEIRTGSLAPMIIILPQGDKGYWVNHADNGPRWGDYVIRDLVPHIDATYRTLRDRSARAIGGLSMGGSGALYHAFTHPDVFSIVGALASLSGRNIAFRARATVCRTSLARTAETGWSDSGTP